MIRALGAIWLARAYRYALAVGLVAVIGAWISVFAWQHEPPGGEIVDGLPNWLDHHPAVQVPGYRKQRIELDGALAHCTRVTERLPPPEIERLPGVLVGREESNEFGTDISGHGRFLAIGAIADDTQGLDRGAVYLYEKVESDGTEAWRQRARILADLDKSPAALSIEARVARFGMEIVLGDGVLAAVQERPGPPAAPDDVPRPVAYVFSSDDGWKDWRQEARLDIGADGAGPRITLAMLDSETLLVARPEAKPTGPGGASGVVHVFRRQQDEDRGRIWVRIGELRAPMGMDAKVRFGSALATNGRTIAVGMERWHGWEDWTENLVRTRRPLPCILLYYRDRPESHPDEWIPLGRIPPPKPGHPTLYGAMVMEGSRLAVTGRTFRTDGLHGEYAVYVYGSARDDGPAETWELEAVLAEPAGRRCHQFGVSTVMERDLIATGGRYWWEGESSSHETEMGTVLVYRRSDRGGWVLANELAIDPTYLPTGLGYALEWHEGCLFMGAADPYPQIGSGSVYWWRPPPP